MTKTNFQKYAGIALASTVVIGGIASAAITPIPVISNTFAVAGQVIKSADINKLAEALNILDARTNGTAPTDPNHLADKEYVDSVSSELQLYVFMSGGSLTSTGSMMPIAGSAWEMNNPSAPFYSKNITLDTSAGTFKVLKNGYYRISLHGGYSNPSQNDYGAEFVVTQTDNNAWIGSTNRSPLHGGVNSATTGSRIAYLDSSKTYKFNNYPYSPGTTFTGWSLIADIEYIPTL